jgi:phage shock protein A
VTQIIANDGNRYLRQPARVVRRVLAPAALELEAQLPGIRQELLALHQQVAELRAQNEQLAGRVGELEQRSAELGRGLHEARRLNLRVAEVTDLVTELVLPLHDREIDPAALQRLRPDTL